MGFLAKGENILIKSGSEGELGSFLYKRETESGSFVDATWGTQNDDFDTPIVNSTWTSYSGYNYLNLGIARQIYEGTHSFTRNVRFDSNLRVTTVASGTPDLSSLVYITALVRGSLTDDASTLTQRVIDEFIAGSYNYVVAIGVMNRDVNDYRAINIDVNDIKTYASSALVVEDYNLPTTEAVYLMNVAIFPTSVEIPSLSLNIYKQEFIEFLGDNVPAPGSIGKTEMNPDYKAERAINNFIMTIDDAHVDNTNTMIISPDYAVQIDENSIYYFNINTSETISYVSLGYYDLESQEYVSSGAKYAVTIPQGQTIANKVCQAYFINDTLTIFPLV